MTVFINKGDDHLTSIQAVNRGRRLFNSQKHSYVRETGLMTGSQDYLDWANQWLNDNIVNANNNHFNYQLKEFRKAIARLDRYILSVGRGAVYEQQPTGEFDEATGEPVTAMALVQGFIEPLPPMIEVTTFDESGTTIAELIDNPLIVADYAEREIAQSVIDGATIEVRGF